MQLYSQGHSARYRSCPLIFLTKFMLFSWLWVLGGRYPKVTSGRLGQHKPQHLKGKGQRERPSYLGCILPTAPPQVLLSASNSSLASGFSPEPFLIPICSSAIPSVDFPPISQLRAASVSSRPCCNYPYFYYTVIVYNNCIH